MKKILLALVILNTLAINAQSINDLDAKNGFGEMHFEDSISLHPNLQAFDQTPDSLYISYRKTNENPQIGGAPVDIIYTFYKGQLYTVMIATNDSSGSKKVLKYFQGLYGKGYQADPYIFQIMWYGQKVILSYYENMNSNKAKIFISSIKMKLKTEGRDKY